MRMKGKNGIVTAAASGMGRAGALRFAAEGAAVSVVVKQTSWSLIMIRGRVF